jgi:UDP-N-acetyl-D-mannosaminuronic acid transferase (WecB/TagA/CpsF family)
MWIFRLSAEPKRWVKLIVAGVGFFMPWGDVVGDARFEVF